MFDTVLTVTPSSKFSAYVNYDYGQNRNFGESFTYVVPSPTKTMTAFPDNSLSRWQGIAAALHFQPTSKWAFTPRFEVFDDPNGFAMNGVDNPSSLGSNGINSVPIRQTVKEITVTGEYKILEGLLWRAEYRYDWSNEPFFIRGIGSDSVCTGTTVAKCAGGFGLQNSKDQNTLTIAFIGFFGPKR